MPKKGIIAVLSALVLMIVASISLVLAVGHNASADTYDKYGDLVSYDEYGNIILSNIDLFDMYYDYSAGGYVLMGLSGEGMDYVGYYGNNGYYMIEVPSEVTSIGRQAFRDDPYCLGMIIHDHISDIGDQAFIGCKTLFSITVDPNNPKYTSQDANGNECNCIIDKSNNTLILGSTQTTIPAGVTCIGDNAFSQRGELLTSITIPDGVTSIGDAAFAYCQYLTSVSLGNSIDSIGNNAFNNCFSLTSITIPDSVTSIGDHAFNNCFNLTSITIPDSVTSIGDHAFDADAGLTRVNLGNGVKTIGNGAFIYCHNITSITIPDSVTSIGEYAFSYCESLTSITIPDSVTSIGDAAFANCQDLTSVSLGNSIDSIGNNAFNNCSSLTSITIPDGVTSIGSQVFEGCNNLTEIIVENPALMNDPNLAPYQSILHCNVQCTVTFETDSEDTIASQTVEYGNMIELPDEPSKPEHNFVGWYRDAEYTEPFNVESPITADVTLYAKWSINQYHVTFMANGGSTVDAQTVDYNATVPEPDDPTRTGYTFDGWYTDAECTQAYDFGDAVTSNTTLYAKWIPEIHTVTFDINGTISSQTVEYGATVTAPTIPTQDGYTFIGWYTEDEQLFNLATPITDDITLHAVWGIRYIVNFVTNGGTIISTQSVSQNGKVEQPIAPMQAGYTFAGWYTDNTFENAYDFDSEVTKNLTLYAKWEPAAVEKESPSNNTGAIVAGAVAGSVAGLGMSGGLVAFVVHRKRRKL